MEDGKSRWALFDDRSRYVDRFGLLLMVTILAVVTLSLVDLRAGTLDDVVSNLAYLAVTVFVGATLLLTLRASGVARRYRLFADALIAIGILGATAYAAFLILADSEEIETVTRVPALWVGLSIVAPPLVVRRLLHHERATMQTLLGAVSAYLLIALAFNFSYLSLDGSNVRFFGEPEPTTSFMYFSLVTLTTLGYGDLAPVEPFGRLLSTAEAVIGQVYLVTFVAMIVGLIVGQRQRARDV
jgi:hypothetical protein